MFKTYSIVAVVSGWALMSAAAAQDGALPFTVAGLGDSEKITKDGAVPASPHFWDAATKTLRLHGGRNEMVAAQLTFIAREDVKGVNVAIGDLKGPGTIPADANIQLFQEIYQFVADGKWMHDRRQALPDRKWYPEILVPFNDPYSSDHKPVGAPFDIKIANGPNQGVWIDIFIPKDAAPGTYTAPITVSIANEAKYNATLKMTVHDFTLPDEAHVDGYGEIYGYCYEMHGAVYKQVGFDKWWAVAKFYHQMAHQHRFVISDREGRGPKFFVQQDLYDKAYAPILDGSLFTKEQGYVGPGAGAGVTFWRAPFEENNAPYTAKPPRDWNPDELKTYTDKAKAFWQHCVEKGWDKKRFFAYIVDEAGSDAHFRTNQAKLAEALDAGAGKNHLNLMWTSHTNPATLAANPETDLRGVIRWWSPNGAACDPYFLQERIKAGETGWFYHHGLPNIGIHGVNATGIDLRTWGTICWRYKLNGSFWWAMDCFGVPKEALTKPIYQATETRWGNGVLFYPGAKLPDIGLPAIAGPLSNLRMKAYRRGQLDYEYGWLLKQKGKEAAADEIVKKVIPIALTDASGTTVAAAAGDASQKAEQQGKVPAAKPEIKIAAPWSTDVNDWYQMRENLAAELERK